MSQVSSPAEAQAALTAPPSAKPQPKTFNHAIARAALSSSQLLQQSSPVGTSPEDPLANALEKYALSEEKVGEARLAQDQLIQTRFLAGWNTTLNTNIQFATKARRAVENSRLSLDATKAAKRNQLQSRGMNPDDETALSEEARAEIEAKEDEFVSQVEEAQSVMKNVSNPISFMSFLTNISRFWIPLNLSAIWPISSLLSSTTTKSRTRSSLNLLHTSTNCRLIRSPSTDKAGKVLR